MALATAERGVLYARREGRRAAAKAAILAHGVCPEVALDLPQALDPLIGKMEVRNNILHTFGGFLRHFVRFVAHNNVFVDSNRVVFYCVSLLELLSRKTTTINFASIRRKVFIKQIE